MIKLLQTFCVSGAMLCLSYFIITSILGYNRFDGHNGYYFFWKDMKSQHLIESDANNSGLVTIDEIDSFVNNKIIKQGYVIHNDKIYTKENKLLTPKDCAKMFLKQYNKK